jgi:hypothetical protein
MSHTGSLVASSPAQQGSKAAAAAPAAPASASSWQCQVEDGGAYPFRAGYTFVFTQIQGDLQYMSTSKAQVTESELFSLGRVAVILWFCSHTIQDEADAVHIMSEDFIAIITSMLKVVTPAWDYDAVQHIAAEILQKIMPSHLNAKQTMDFVTFVKGLWTLTNMFLPSNSSWHLRALWIAKVRM